MILSTKFPEGQLKFGGAVKVWMIAQMEKESCAVCWRDLSTIIKPALLPCGHTYCIECSESLRTCPLCRRKIPSNYRIPTNFSLLSLIEKNEAKWQPETRAQETQTEDNPPIQHLTTSIQRTIPQTGTRRVKSSQKQGIKFKFARSDTGVLEGMEISIM